MSAEQGSMARSNPEIHWRNHWIDSGYRSRKDVKIYLLLLKCETIIIRYITVICSQTITVFWMFKLLSLFLQQLSTILQIKQQTDRLDKKEKTWKKNWKYQP
jgi:hypothetical protein